MIELYCVVDDFLKAHPRLAPWRHSPLAQPQFSDAEVLTIALLQGVFEVATLKPTYRLVAQKDDIYSLSNPWLVNFKVRLFSVTARTTFSGAPSGISASISNVTRTDEPTSPTKCEIISSAILLASRPARSGVKETVP